MIDLAAITQSVRQVIDELQEAAQLTADQILVIGASSSEVIGQRIGTAGSSEVARAIVDGVLAARDQYGFQVAFQGCEHINRALVTERAAMEQFGLEEVTVVPVPKAGGAVASEVFRRLQQPVVVEHVKAHAGIDIGDTFIGMHLRHVAVPVRPSIKTIGEAHVTMAHTRPKLIGGARAVYLLEAELNT